MTEASITVDGQWSQWSSWSDCSVTCDGGTQSSNRTCSDPAPEYGGFDCDGNATHKIQTCNTEVCPPLQLTGMLEVIVSDDCQKTRTRSCHTECIQWETESSSYTIGNHQGVESPEACQIHCQSNPSCQAFVWGISGPVGGCWLKSQLNSVLVRDEQRVTGRREC